MANRYFVDTGAYFSLFYKRDQYHNVSRGIWSRLRKEAAVIITTNHVLDELATLLARKTSYEFASKKMQALYEAKGLWIERTDEQDEKMAISYFTKYADKRISFTDCLSFVVMERLEIEDVFTFDRHFDFAGKKCVSTKT